MTTEQKSNRNRAIFIGIVVLIVLVVVTFPLWSPYFINDIVDEAFPGLSADERNAIREMPEDEREALVELSNENAEMAAETARSMMEADKAMTEDMPEEPIVLVEGTFTFIDAVHNGEGTASIYELPDGQRVLRLSDFRVTNGPDLHVMLSPEAPDSIFGDIGEAVDLGQLKGNIGNQNYDIPEDVNLDDYASVVIYCQPFKVVFSTAPLTQPE
jgi:hypothetical protein